MEIDSGLRVWLLRGDRAKIRRGIDFSEPKVSDTKDSLTEEFGWMGFSDFV